LHRAVYRLHNSELRRRARGEKSQEEMQGWARREHIQGQGQGHGVWSLRPIPRPVAIKYKVKAKLV